MLHLTRSFTSKVTVLLTEIFTNFSSDGFH